jgi:hypothetical protein
LPKAEHDAEEWEAAMQVLLLVADHDGPTMFARIGIMTALNRHIVRKCVSSCKRRALGLAQAQEGPMTAGNSERWNFAWDGSTEAFMQRSETLSNDGSRTPALGTSTHDQENNA